MSTQEMYDVVFGEGKFNSLSPELRLKLIDFSRLCQNEGGNMMLEVVKEREAKLKEIEKSI